MEIKDEEKLVKLLQYWKDRVSKTPKEKDYDLTDDSGWHNTVNRLKEIVAELEAEKDEGEIRSSLKKLFKHKGKDKLIWASQAGIITAFIENCEKSQILRLMEIVLDVKRSKEFKKGWIDDFHSMLENWNADSVQNFRGLKGILSNVFGELFGKLHMEDYPIMNSCSRRFLEKFFEFVKYDYNGFYQAFEKLKEIYLKEVGRLSEDIPVNTEIDMMFNYFDKDDEGKRVFIEILKSAPISNLDIAIQELKNNFEDEWRSIKKEFMTKIEQIKDIIYNKIDQNLIFSEQDADEILRISKNVPKKCRFLLSFIVSAGGPEKDVLLSLINNEHFVDFVNSLKESELDAIKANYDAIKNEVSNVGHTALTTWLAILRPDLFMPIWGHVKDPGTLPPAFLKDFEELKKFVKWENLSTNDLFELLEVLRDAANVTGINNMFEAAFYINKYEQKSKTESSLTKVLSELKKNYQEEWNGVREDILNAINDLERLITERIDQGSEFRDENISEIIRLGKRVNLIRKYMTGASGSDKQAILTLLNNPEFREFVMFLKANDELSWDEISNQLKKIKPSIDKIKNVGLISFSTWMAVLRPDYFIPGPLSEKLCSDIPELEEFNDDWYKRGDVIKFSRRLQIVKEAADSVGINDMFEAAFYLSKYESKKEQENGRRIWLMAPGRRAEHWDVCVKQGIICVGWREAVENLRGVLLKIDDRKMFETEMSKFGYTPQDFSQLWKFLKEVSKGDILLAKKGARKIIGIGVVDSEPEIDLQMDYPIYRKVVWLRNDLDIDSPKQFAGTITELTDEDLERVPELKKIIDKMIEVGPKANKYLEEMGNKIETILTSKKQLILYGPPGTGKTWLTRNYIEAKTNDNREFYDFVTFHPSYSYEEFVEGLKPIPAGNGVNFVVEDGIFKRMAIKAMCKALRSQNDYPELSKISENLLKSLKEIEKGITATKNDVLGEYSKLKKELWTNLISLDEKELKSLFKGSDQVREFYLAIDEINRGDISKIFGELITLLEADKRLGGENQIFVTLPYSKEPFAVPPNLHIIGTMNTADRSIALIDVALRRRFGFIEVMPSYRVLLKELLDKEVESEKQAIEEIKRWEPENLDENDSEDTKKLAIRVLYSINERIKKLYDRDHQIGHSYLLKLKEGKDADSTIRTLRFIWYHEILPLLQEYFYDSPEKLNEVVKGFVKADEDYFELEYFEDNSEFIQELKKVAGQSE